MTTAPRSPSAICVRRSRNGTTTFTFTLNATAPIYVPLTLLANTAAGSAGVDDYQAVNNREVILAAGATSQTIEVTVNGDGVVEGDDTFFLELTGFSRRRPGRQPEPQPGRRHDGQRRWRDAVHR